MVSHEDTDDPAEGIVENDSERPEEHDATEAEEGEVEGRQSRAEQATPPYPPDGPSRYEGERRPGTEYERPPERPSYRGRHENRVPKAAPEEEEMGARERREQERRERRKMHERRERREQQDGHEGEDESESRDDDEKTETVPKYGGPRDPNWRRRREQARQRHLREMQIRGERRMKAALARQRGLQGEKSGTGGKRYQRGRR